MEPETVTKPKPYDISLKNKSMRAVWGLVWLILYRPSPRTFHFWRRFLLRCFGARISSNCYPYPAARIWAPWNLEMHEGSCLSDNTDCYSVAKVTLQRGSTVSQYSFLCTAGHDIDSDNFQLITAPIEVGVSAWIAADCYVGPGVNIGDGAVVGARSSVFKDVPARCVVVGNPARIVRRLAQHGTESCE